MDQRRDVTLATRGRALRTLAFTFTFTLSLALVSGCSGGDDGGGDTEGATPASFEQACAGLFSCACEDFGFPSQKACVDAYAFDWGTFESQVKAAGLTPDADCFASQLPYPAFGCVTPEEVADAGLACELCQYGYGKLGPGAPCTYVSERVSDCAQGLVCPKSGSAVCIDPCAPAAVGESCGLQPCADGLHCDLATLTCAVRPTLGQSCDTVPCKEPYGCFGGVCTETSGIDEDCFAHLCDPVLVCDTYGGICVLPGKDGDECNTHPCAVDFVCQPDDLLCKALPTLGQTCTGECASGFECDTEIHLCVHGSPLICAK